VSIALIQAAFEQRLETLTPAVATAYENVTFSPVAGQPYQRINMLVNRPVDHAVTLDVTEERGIFQVSLFYPQGTGRGASQARAELIKALFKPPLTLTNGAVKVDINKTVHVGGGMPDGDRWMVPVSIYWQSFQAT
jgi:hypothetical protein